MGIPDVVFQVILIVKMKIDINPHTLCGTLGVQQKKEIHEQLNHRSNKQDKYNEINV